MRRRRASVELFEAIRREYEFGVGTIQGVGRKLGVHRRMVREALARAVPAERLAAKRARPHLGPLAGFIDRILEADRKAPRKQRHTAHRIYVRIGQERPVKRRCATLESDGPRDSRMGITDSRLGGSALAPPTHHAKAIQSPLCLVNSRGLGTESPSRNYPTLYTKA